MDNKNTKTEVPMPNRLTFNIEEEAIKLLTKNGNDVFTELIDEKKQEKKKEYIIIIKKAIEEWNKLYKEVNEIKEDKPEIRDLKSGSILYKAGISLPLLNKRNKLIKDADIIVEGIKEARNGNFKPIIVWLKSFKDKKQNNND